ncbi:L-threonylcarbamoyladenylate synthase [Lactococcus kimchii]|uniref:L-threonylcarbamoyladenylate synthase n=1 Tax=Lactococcus sp. S-13 TaxID=2507158 RepID=UPI001023B636|nr:threonylcarbamoyl-AMP synthase [Lactococcus sp. S-13]
MKVENDLRTMASFLQTQIMEIKTLIDSGKVKKAKESLNFFQAGLTNFTQRIEKLDGSYPGISRRLFRHVYKVPQDVQQKKEHLLQQTAQLQKVLDKEFEKQRNSDDRKQGKAIKALQAGDLAILPTETVYGLFANALNEQAVQKLYAVKGRPTEKALNMNVSSFSDIIKYSKNQPAYLEKLVSNFLPGPLTIILEASDQVPEWIHIGKTTVGFRMPEIVMTQKIIKEVGVLVGPSANLTGSPSPRFFADLSPAILKNSAVAVQDDSIYGLDTTIIDLTQEKPTILRQGAITKDELVAKVPELEEIQ